MRFNEQHVGQSPTTISGSTRSLQRCDVSLFFIYTRTSTMRVSIRHLERVLGSFPSTSFTHQKRTLSSPLQGNSSANPLLTSSANFAPTEGFVLSLATLCFHRSTCSAVGPSWQRRCTIKTRLGRGFQYRLNSLVYM